MTNLDAHRLLAEAKELLPDAVKLRRRIHAKPELGLQLPLTTQAVLESLQGLDVGIARGPTTSGVMVSLAGRGNGKTILLRGDMDALPMPEDTGLPYASEFENRMHACGHDAHTAMLVEAVHLLHRHRGDFAGTVKFMFQPGEEGYHGARFMIEDGLLDADPKPDAAFAMHILPNLRADALAGRAGAVMASADRWSIKVKGQGGHASAPHDAIDPVPVAFEIGLALQNMVTRRHNVFDPVVVTVAKVTAGTTDNVISEMVELEGTLRAISPGARQTAREGIERVAENIAAAHLCTAEIAIESGYPVTVNDAGFVDFARKVARDLGGEKGFIDMPAPVMGAEDFSYVLQRIPGCMFVLGVMPKDRDPNGHIPSVHSNRMTLNEDSMAMGIAMHAAVATRFLAQES
jgi:amidohydrolase